MSTTSAPSGEGAERLHDIEERLVAIANTIQEFAALHFEARAPVGPNGDIVDAVSAGVNFLGEELEASFGEIERRVADRTAELAAATKELGHRALHDELTELPNRALFWDRLSHRLSVADRRRTGFAVLFLDLDDFKGVNDTLGHAVGDRLLVDVAARIRGELRAGDTAARVGGDEFVVLLDDVTSEEEALGIARRLGDTLREPYDLGTARCSAPSSIGVAVMTENLANADALVGAADAAMYDAKQSGRGLCVLYSEERHGGTKLGLVGDVGHPRPARRSRGATRS